MIAHLRRQRQVVDTHALHADVQGAEVAPACMQYTLFRTPRAITRAGAQGDKYRPLLKASKRYSICHRKFDGDFLNDVYFIRPVLRALILEMRGSGF